MHSRSIYVFGAGASAGSQQSVGSPGYGSRARSNAAPLVDELFDQKYVDHADFIDLSRSELAEIRNQISPVKSVEKWLTEEWNSSQDLHPEIALAKRRIFGKIVFYIWRIVVAVSRTYHDRDWHAVFVRKLRRKGKPFGFISFNYDLLLDRAVESAMGADLSGMEGYVAANLIKPHGSANWLLGKRQGDKPVPGISDVRASLRLAAIRMFDSPFSEQRIRVFMPSAKELADQSWDPENLARYTEGVFYPLIVLPLTTKMYHIEGFERTAIEQAVNLVRQAEEIYLIGYRALDSIIADILRAADDGTVLHVAGRGDAAEVMERITTEHSQLRKGNVHVDGFEAFADGI